MALKLNGNDVVTDSRELIFGSTDQSTGQLLASEVFGQNDNYFSAGSNEIYYHGNQWTRTNSGWETIQQFLFLTHGTIRVEYEFRADRILQTVGARIGRRDKGSNGTLQILDEQSTLSDSWKSVSADVTVLPMSELVVQFTANSSSSEVDLRRVSLSVSGTNQPMFARGRNV